MYFNLIVRWTLYNLKQSSIFMFQSDCALYMIQIKDKLLYLYLNSIGGGNHRPAASHRQNKSPNVVSSTPLLCGDRH